MMQNIVMWGEVGTDQKVLLAIKLKEEENKVHIFGFQKEKVTKEIQDKLFSEWKNGGEFDFPEGIYHWIVPASNDNILPDDVRICGQRFLIIESKVSYHGSIQMF